MRISDWSSDVCSSDLIGTQPPGRAVDPLAPAFLQPQSGAELAGADLHDIVEGHLLAPAMLHDREVPAIIIGIVGVARPDRSEEHTSELQSLMRISYAVFCLKKQKLHNIKSHNDHIL